MLDFKEVSTENLQNQKDEIWFSLLIHKENQTTNLFDWCGLNFSEATERYNYLKIEILKRHLQEFNN